MPLFRKKLCSYLQIVSGLDMRPFIHDSLILQQRLLLPSAQSSPSSYAVSAEDLAGASGVHEAPGRAKRQTASFPSESPAAEGRRHINFICLTASSFFLCFIEKIFKPTALGWRCRADAFARRRVRSLLRRWRGGLHQSPMHSQ